MIEGMDDKGNFFRLLDAVGVPQHFDREFLYRAYALSYEGAQSVGDIAPGMANIAVNPVSLSLYLITTRETVLGTVPRVSQSYSQPYHVSTSQGWQNLFWHSPCCSSHACRYLQHTQNSLYDQEELDQEQQRNDISEQGNILCLS